MPWHQTLPPSTQGFMRQMWQIYMKRQIKTSDQDKGRHALSYFCPGAATSHGCSQTLGGLRAAHEFNELQGPLKAEAHWIAKITILKRPGKQQEE